MLKSGLKTIEESCAYFCSALVMQQDAGHRVRAFSFSLSQQDTGICFLKSSALVNITAQGNINTDQPYNLQDVTECEIS